MGLLRGLAAARRSAVAVIAIVTAAGLAVPVIAASPAAAVSGKGMAIGAYADGSQEMPPISNQADLGRLEQQLGHRFDVDHEYLVFNKGSFAGVLGDDQAKGRMPYVNMSWNCGCRSNKKGNAAAKNYWAAVAQGRYDGWLSAQATTVRNFGRTFFVTWQHEPEHTYGWEGTPADYIRAWQHVVQLFRAKAPNVRFVTSLLPTSYRMHKGHAKADLFWPGSAYVDVVGSTGYNWACSAHTGNQPGCGKTWKSFSAVFGPVNTWVTQKAGGRPWWVTETGVAEDPSMPGRKAQWINDMQRTADSWPKLTGIIFFFGSRSYHLFLPGTSTSSLNAFRWAAAEWSG